MAKNYKHLLVSMDLENEIQRVRIAIKQQLNLDLNKVEATRFISWKSRNYNVPINKQVLLEIIRG